MHTCNNFILVTLVYTLKQIQENMYFFRFSTRFCCEILDVQLMEYLTDWFKNKSGSLSKYTRISEVAVCYLCCLFKEKEEKLTQSHINSLADDLASLFPDQSRWAMCATRISQAAGKSGTSAGNLGMPSRSSSIYYTRMSEPTREKPNKHRRVSKAEWKGWRIYFESFHFERLLPRDQKS